MANTEATNNLNEEAESLIPATNENDSFNLQDLDPNYRARLEQLPNCSICGRKVYSNGKFGTPTDHRFLIICRCNHYVHHACATSLVTQHKRCASCQQRFSYKIYGTAIDFVSRNIYILVVPLLLYLLTFAVGLLIGFSIYPNASSGPTAVHKLLLFIIGFTLFASTVIYASWTYFVVTVKLRRFRKRYRQITVHWHSEVPRAIRSNRLSSYQFTDMTRFTVVRAEEEPTQNADEIEETGSLIV